MEGQLRELLPFLRDKNPQVRQIALSNLLPQTPKESPHRAIFFTGLQGGGLQKSKEKEVIRDLKLLCRDQLAVAHDAFRALVNLSDSPLLVPALSEPLFLNFLVSYILSPDSTLADLASMLLSNLTASSGPCSTLLSLSVPMIGPYPTNSRSGTSPAPLPYPQGEPQERLALPLLVDAFVQASATDPSGDLSKRPRKGDLHFLASVFANITTSPAGRIFFFQPYSSVDGRTEYPLAKIVPFTEHKDKIRRGGVASTMKNCAFHVPGHRAFLSPEDTLIKVPPSTIEAPGIDALPYLLLPLAGPEEFDLDDQERLLSSLQFLPPTKTREADPSIRLTHVETLLLLCHTRWGRDYLREHGTYEIVRATHECETVDKISEHIERLVQLLKGDEPSHSIDEVDNDNEVGVDAGVSPPKSKAIEAAPKEDSDDEDNIIEEI
ncbi:hypothetical protein PC9H_006202 [Pleurotus ostreatus]|uniref:Protein HGH1 homolog n=1 Tax=Pleurotus ostreatus TaxID=5322 RepID=A0A8H6ZTD0_PLEOS|nr:uncharacterized protein PC9H_006202 [Pleurotus ostreatus]KAF7430494.1 hypothetical protein PC9H_006202 [Pleurotus ostreatus]KAJ8694771.1 Protein hgh1 [Pleurotus ostreatus]